MLDKLQLKDSYSSDEDDIVKEFYNPVLERATSYDRISGYFSPVILALAARGFSGLIANGGKIRILTSVQVSQEIYDAVLSNNSAEVSDRIFDVMDFDVNNLKSELQKDYLRVFMYLYKTGLLELKVAIISEKGGILHQKVGIVRDKLGNAISFSGSNNETVGGVLNNLEEFKVFKNWIISSSTYYADDETKFDKYWNNKVKNVRVLKIGDAIKQKIITITDTPNDITPTVNRIKLLEEDEKNNNLKHKNDRFLRDYQVKAIQHWVEHSYQSIFEMATGTGKTFTAINALRRFFEDKSYLRAVVVVPLTTLTIQWQSDIKKLIPSVTIINTSTDNNWRQELSDIKFSSSLGQKVDYIIITTYSMFSKKEFGEKISSLSDDNILLADEMHNLVNQNRINALSNPTYKYKLGLSATPTRLWQQAESAIARLHFGDNSYQYSLSDAIQNGFLVPYNYHPLSVYLGIDEYEEYVKLSKDIARMSQIESNDDENSALNMKLIARSRIKKNAYSKIASLESTIKKLCDDDKLYNALIYVDNEDFLQKIQIMLTDNNIRTTKFVGNNSLEDRLTAIDNLRNKRINAIVAIKCLDEGVDIPSAKLAFFISNNTDPREYVQRLGRVLRRDDEGGKERSEVYDYIVMPPKNTAHENELERRIARNMVKNELIRSRFFNELSSNAKQAKEIIEDTVDSYGFYFDEDELTYNTESENVFDD